MAGDRPGSAVAKVDVWLSRASVCWLRRAPRPQRHLMPSDSASCTDLEAPVVEVVEVTGIETVAGRDPVTAVEIEIGIEGATGEASEETEAEIAVDLLPLARVLDWATEVTTAARPAEVATGATAEIEAVTGVVTETDGVGPAGTAVSVAVEATGAIIHVMK